MYLLHLFGIAYLATMVALILRLIFNSTYELTFGATMLTQVEASLAMLFTMLVSFVIVVFITGLINIMN